MPPPSSQALQELDCLDKSSSYFDDKLHNILHGQEYALHEANFEDDDLVFIWTRFAATSLLFPLAAQTA